jgi:hypothetical protein
MRTDVHTPSRIIPSDYEYVGVWTMNIQGLGDAEFILREREAIRAHMTRTAGDYAHVDTTGSCQVCGNVQAIYLALFWHRPTNTYVRVGFDCTSKLEMSGDERAFNLFRKNVQNAREAQAGKRKAIAILGDNGLSAAWDIFTAEFPKHLEDCKAAGVNSFGDDNGVENPCTCDREVRCREFDAFPERTIRDIVGKLVKYGSVSEKQMGFIATLLKQITDRPIVEAQRQAEKDAAGPVPTGRVQMTGTVLMVKEYDKPRFSYHDSDTVTKVLIRLENGSKVMGARFENIEKGETVTFTATVEASKDDPKFGFFKRASLPKPELTAAEKKVKDAYNKLHRAIKKAGFETTAWEAEKNGHLENYEARITMETLANQLYRWDSATGTTKWVVEEATPGVADLAVK